MTSRRVRSVGMLLLHSFFGVITFLVMFLPLILISAPPVWRDPLTRSSLVLWNLVLAWLATSLWIWRQHHWTRPIVRWLLTLGASLIVLTVGYGMNTLFFGPSGWQRLKELGITLDSYQALSIERQLEVLIEVAPYRSDAEFWMAVAIARNGRDALEPVVWTIRAHLPRAREGDRVSREIVFWLPEALREIYWSGLFLNGTAAEPLIVELACDPRNADLEVSGDLDWDLLRAIHPEIAPDKPTDAAWVANACESLGWPPP